MKDKGPSRWTQVEEILTKIIEIRKEKLGLGHHDTLLSKETFLEMLISQERWDEAETGGTEILEIRKMHLGVGHVDTFRNMNELVKISMVQDRLNDAEQYQLQVRMLESLKSVWPSESVQAHHNHYS